MKKHEETYDNENSSTETNNTNDNPIAFGDQSPNLLAIMSGNKDPNSLPN